MRKLAWIVPAALAALVVAAVLVLSGEAEDDVFTADEFVARANEEGAGLVLVESQELFSEEGESHAIDFVGAGSEPEHADEEGDGHAHGAATLVVSDDSDGALETYERCEAAITLTCFRAANVALQVEAGTPDELARLETAFRALGEEG